MKWIAATAVSIAAAAFVLSVIAMSLASDGSARAAGEPAGGSDDPPEPSAEATPETLQVALTDFAITPSELHVTSGAPVTVEVTNEGGTAHDFVVEGVDGTPLLGAGESAMLDLGALDEGTYQFYCSIPGHADLGMSGTLVAGEGGATGAVGGEAPGAGHMTSEEMDASYMAGVEAFPAATEGLGGQLLEPRIEDGVKVFELTASEFEWEVAPGDVRQAMGYNGQVPGPEIRVQLGDRVRVILHNELSESTAIHYHGLVVPNEMDGVPGLTQPLVKPGESFTYEFTVENAGSHMYHSHMNGAHQIPAGLLGAFVVEGEDEPEVDQDIVMVLNDGPLGYSINGKGFPATQPIVASEGERIRIRYMNEGLQIHPMHLHGMPQLVIARDGYPLPEPYYADTILVAPGERIDVLVEATELGLWAFHCHILTHAENEQGMFGMVTVMIVEE